MATTPPSSSSSTSRERIAKTWGYVRPYRVRLVGVIVLCALTTACSLAPPILVEKVIDRALAPPFDLRLLFLFCAAVAGVTTLRFGLGLVQQYQLTFVTSRVLLRMRQDFYRHLQTLSLAFFSRTRIGEILTRLNRDISEIQGVATGALPGLIVSLLTIVGTVVILALYDWRLLLASSAVLPPALLIARRFRGPVGDQTRDIRETNERMGSFLVETVSGMKHVRAYGQEKREARRFIGLQRELIARVMRLMVTTALAGGLPRYLVSFSSVVVFAYGGWLVTRGELQLGDLVAFSLLQGRVFGPVQGLLGLYVQLRQAAVSLDRIYEYRDLPAATLDRPGARRLGPLRGEIALDRVSFSYGPDAFALADVTLAIGAGERIALVGRSGSGKSTLIDLILRLQRPDSGRVLVDGFDLADVVRATLVRQVALVSQDAFVRHASLLENVLYARPDAAATRVREVVERTGLHHVAARMPQGLDSLIGERGARLSGGEKQRLAIARALLVEPRILVLDEATSSLDRESDRGLAAALDDLTAGRTVIAITHSLRDLASYHRVFFLEGGRLVATGSHEHLMARDDYARLWGVPA